ncbi:MAG TPA: NifU N-terminal domain-containing protein [Anaerolineae bacterium]|nr:NifU N-terminal domain-containing protein [Anaerolineae bacterium]
MSEYIEIESEPTDDLSTMIIHTNLLLADGDPEHYRSVEAMEEGSPVAQALASIEGIAGMRIESHDLVVELDLRTPWHSVEGEITTALKEFFL